jgi:hypothetical protein
LIEIKSGMLTMGRNNIKFLYVTALIILICMGIGCLEDSTPISAPISSGKLEKYEFNLTQNNLTNSTTIYLYKNKTVRVVTSVVNVTSLTIIKPEGISVELKSEKGPGIRDFVVMGNISSIDQSNHYKFHNFSNTSYNTTYVKSKRKKTINVEFAQQITGFVAYSYSWEYGQFYYDLSRNETLNVVLPPDHNTGNIILGNPKPTRPDNKITDNNNRIWLIWNNPYPKQKFIAIKYYKSSLPTILGMTGIILGAVCLIGFVYFHNQIRKLRQKREAYESDLKKN